MKGNPNSVLAKAVSKCPENLSYAGKVTRILITIFPSIRLEEYDNPIYSPFTQDELEIIDKAYEIRDDIRNGQNVFKQEKAIEHALLHTKKHRDLKETLSLKTKKENLICQENLLKAFEVSEKIPDIETRVKFTIKIFNRISCTDDYDLLTKFQKISANIKLNNVWFRSDHFEISKIASDQILMNKLINECFEIGNLEDVYNILASNPQMIGSSLTS